MEQSTHSLLAAWETFYVIIGSSGAALTGLQFVVIALVAESPRRATTREISAFGTPTTIHFCAVLFIGAITLHRYPRRVLFMIAASALLLLFIGIHNAWDTVTYIAIDQAEP